MENSTRKISLIAEIGQAHDGSLGIAHSYIDAVANTGVSAVKFQTHIAEAESSFEEPFRVNFSYEDKTRFDYWKRMEFTPEQWAGLKSHCDEVGIEFLSSPFSIAAVDLLETLGVKRYKIGSGEMTNKLMLDKIARTGKPVILSSGMSSFSELDDTIHFLRNRSREISLLQCTTSYPTKPEDWGLNVISELKRRYNIPIGFSDHSGDIYACIAATAVGAEILEFHVVFDQKMFGPDAKSSIEISQLPKLVSGIEQVEKAVSNKIDKSNNSRFEELKCIFEKSLSVNRDMQAGEIVGMDDLETKKPAGLGISSSKFQNVLGKKLVVDKVKNEFLTDKDLKW